MCVQKVNSVVNESRRIVTGDGILIHIKILLRGSIAGQGLSSPMA